MKTARVNKSVGILFIALLPLVLCACGEEDVYFDENTGQMSYEAIGADESGTCWCKCPGEIGPVHRMKVQSEDDCPAFKKNYCSHGVNAECSFISGDALHPR